MKKTPQIRELKIGYQLVKIEFVGKEDRDHDGSYDEKSHVIRLIFGQKDAEQANTMLHECLHALWYTGGLKEWVEDEDMEEPVVNSLANGLTQIFRDNPKLFDWLKGNLNG